MSFHRRIVLIVVVWCLVFVHMGSAQTREPFALDYTIIPDSENIGFERLHVKGSIPTKLKGEGHFLINYFEYEHITINFNRDYGIDIAPLENLHTITYGLAYRRALKNNWDLTASVSPVIASNLDFGGLSNEDLFINGALSFRKKYKEKNASLSFGGIFNAATGIPFPIPFLSYQKTISPKITYVLGIPDSRFIYRLDNKNTISLYAFFDGYFVNIQQPILVEGANNAESISLFAAGIGLNYRRKIFGNLIGFASIGDLLTIDSRLLDGNRDEVLNFEKNSSLYIRFGLLLAFGKK